MRTASLWILVATAVVSGGVWACARWWGRRSAVETAGPTFIEKFNQGVRAMVLIAMTAGFVYGFIVSRISGEVFIAVYGTVLGYWFASREAKARAQADQPTTTTETKDTKVITGPTKPVSG